MDARIGTCLVVGWLPRHNVSKIIYVPTMWVIQAIRDKTSCAAMSMLGPFVSTRLHYTSFARGIKGLKLWVGSPSLSSRATIMNIYDAYRYLRDSSSDEEDEAQVVQSGGSAEEDTPFPRSDDGMGSRPFHRPLCAVIA